MKIIFNLCELFNIAFMVMCFVKDYLCGVCFAGFILLYCLIKEEMFYKEVKEK